MIAPPWIGLIALCGLIWAAIGVGIVAHETDQIIGNGRALAFVGLAVLFMMASLA